MSGTWLAVAIIAAVVVITLVAIAVWRTARTRNLRSRFGPEYDHTVETADSRRDAERDLRDRAARRDDLQIRELSAAAATRYQEHWLVIQQEFVDSPAQAVHAAQTLVTNVMRERGYPTDTTDERESMLSVDHADVMGNYRTAAAIEARETAGTATTEDLRQALQHYRKLFDRLLGDAANAAKPSSIDITEREDVTQRQ